MIAIAQLIVHGFAKIKRTNLLREGNVKICNLHFEESSSERDLKNKLLGKLCRRLPKKHPAFSTWFEYNINLVETKKRPANKRREQKARERQDKDAFNNTHDAEQMN